MPMQRTHGSEPRRPSRSLKPLCSCFLGALVDPVTFALRQESFMSPAANSGCEPKATVLHSCFSKQREYKRGMTIRMLNGN